MTHLTFGDEYCGSREDDRQGMGRMELEDHSNSTKEVMVACMRGTL